MKMILTMRLLNRNLCQWISNSLPAPPPFGVVWRTIKCFQHLKQGQVMGNQHWFVFLTASCAP